MVTVCPMALAKSTLPTPTLLNQAGGLLSNFHDSVPLPPWASKNTTMCGFTQSTFVTEPVRVNLLHISNRADGEWCPHKDAAAERTIKTTEILLKAALLSNDREYTIADFCLINVVDHRRRLPARDCSGAPTEECRRPSIPNRYSFCQQSAGSDRLEVAVPTANAYAPENGQADRSED